MCFEFGRAADRLLAYQTERVVRLKHAKVGCSYYVLVVLTLFYVVGVQLLYDNAQFDKRQVLGTPRLAVWQPTVGFCTPANKTCKADYSSFTVLPYCDVFSGGGSTPPARVQYACVIADRHSLLPKGALAPNVLLPTRIERTAERRTCGILAGSNGTCDGAPATVKEMGRHYVADIERYSVLISHSYRRDTMSGNNNRVPGFYQECIERHDKAEKVSIAVFGASACPGDVMHRPIECLDDTCAFLLPRGSQAPPASFLQSRRGGRSEAAATPGVGQSWQLLNDGVFALPDGDIFTVGKLLELAGVSSLDNATTLDGLPLREAGVVLDIAVRYGNLYPFASSFGRRDVRYEYIVSLQPTHQAKNELITKSSTDGSELVLEDRNGLYFTVRVEGEFGFFSVVNLLLALAEGATLLTVATVMTDKIAVYLLEDADDNFHAKYHEVRRDGVSSEAPAESLREEPVASSSKDHD